METLAKIERPRMENICCRGNLFARLDQAFQRRVVWISAGAGYGKTTIASSYLEQRKKPYIWYQIDAGDSDISSFFFYLGLLGKKAALSDKRPFPLFTAEYQTNIQTFSRNFFRELYRRLQTESIIVFDNFEALPDHSTLHEVLKYAIEELPRDLRIMVLSRSDPHRNLVRLRSRRLVSILTVDDMRLTLDESTCIVLMRKKSADATSIKALHDQTQGWVSGIIIFLEQADCYKCSIGSCQSRGRFLVFDYFSSEIFNLLESDHRLFAIKTAFLPKFTVSMATKLTGIQTAHQILRYLVQRNCFTFFHPGASDIYSYHALFRDFLIEEARRCLSRYELDDLIETAAVLLEESAMIEDAAELFIQLRAWPHLVNLVLKNAETILMQGRNATLRKWIHFLPEDYRKKTPWVEFWYGMCRLPFSPLESRSAFENSFNALRRQGDIAGTYLSWAFSIETFIYHYNDLERLDDWIAVFDEVRHEFPAFPSMEIEARAVSAMISALLFRQPFHPALQDWVERGKDLLYRCTDVKVQFILTGMLNPYCAWIGDFPLFRFILQTLQTISSRSDDNLLPLLRKFTAEAQLGWLTADWTACDTAVEQALKISEQSGIGLQNFELVGAEFYRYATSTEDPCILLPLLDKLASMRQSMPDLMQSHFYYMKSWYDFLAGDARTSLQDIRLSRRLLESYGRPPFQIGLTCLGAAQIFFELKQVDAAQAAVDEALEIGNRMGSQVIMFHGYCLRAYFFFGLDRDREANDALRTAMTVAARANLVNYPWWRSAVMTRLCLRAMENGIEPIHTLRLIQQRDLYPKEPPLHVPNWPWPVKIFTLGTFRLVRYDEEVSFSGKAPKRPLDLLKALIACGGRDVPVHELGDLLWPDADGDSAYQSFTMALKRLRMLVGAKSAIVLAGGNLSMDRRYCWIDALAFETALSKAENDPARSLEAIALYKGAFLEKDGDSPWAIRTRNRLKQKYLDAVLSQGRRLESEGEHPAAIDLYNNAMQVDEPSEALHQALMRCHHRTGQTARLAMAHQQSRQILERHREVDPATKTIKSFQMDNESNPANRPR